MVEAIGIIALVLIAWFHYHKTGKDEFKVLYLLSLILKIIAGVGVGLIYKYYYTGGDTWNYFEQAKLFGSIGFDSWSNFKELFINSNYYLVNGFSYVGQPRAALMVKIVAAVNLLTNSNYWLSSMYFTFFSFTGIWAFSTWIYRNFANGRLAAVIVLFWPSFMFWSSGVLKESVAVGLIFWIIPTWFKMIASRRFNNMPFLLVASYFLFLIKYYFAVSLIVVLLVYTIIELTALSKKNILTQTLAWLSIMAFGLLIGGFLHPNLNANNVLAVIIGNNESFSTISNTESLILFADIGNSNWIWLIVNSPKALIASLFLPLVLNGNSIAYSISAIENWMLLLLFVRGILIIRKPQLKLYFTKLLAAISYITLLSVFLALSTPNLGTLARYKVAFIPVFLVLIIIANRLDKTSFSQRVFIKLK